MKKIIQPSICETYNGCKVKAYAAIEYDGTRLSIRGVVGPMGSGDCIGGAGQCTDEIREGTPADGWTRDMLDEFCRVWDRWHLNDMRPTCEHQRELGWDERAKATVYRFNFTLDDETRREKSRIEQEALTALRSGKTFRPSAKQARLASMPFHIALYSHDESMDAPDGYKAPLPASVYARREKKTLGGIKPEEFKGGLLCRPCPVCGYRYGSAWNTEPVPEDVITWLFALPNSPTTPAWV